MTTPIPEVDTERSIEFGVLIDLTLIAINPTTGASGTGSTATLTFATEATAPFAVGDTITVSNMVPAGYNGTFIVTAATTSSVSYASTATGSQTQAGIIGKTYYVSNCYKNVTYNSKTYQALAGFLSVSEIQSNISNANDEIQLGLSAIPPSYIAATLGTQIKGGEVNIYRVFFNYTTQEVITDAVYRRFTGIISNFSVQEDLDTTGDSPEVTHTITIIASSIMGVLENKISGRRTNREDYQIVWPELGNSSSDPSMNRVDTLFNSTFDFGKKYNGNAVSNVNGGGSGGGSGGNNDNPYNYEYQS
jgi:hypothetical protein